MGSPADRTANRVVDVQTFISTGQSLKDLEKYIQSLGRSLSDVERRILLVLPGMISQFDKAEKELKDFGKVSSDTIKTLKVNLQGIHGIPQALNKLSQFNPQTGLSKNQRNDKSFEVFGKYLADVVGKLNASMERSYKEWDDINDTLSKLGLSPIAQKNIQPPGTTYLDALLKQMRSHLPVNTVGSDVSSITSQTIGSMALGIPDDRTTGMRDPLAFGKKWGEYSKQVKLQLDKIKVEMRAQKLSLGASMVEGLDKAFGNIPLLGALTNTGKTVVGGAKGVNDAGKALDSLAGTNKTLKNLSKFMTGTGGALLGAIAAGVGLFVAQLKKSSPVLQAVFDIFELAWNLLFMPLGNALGELLLPMAEYLINFAIAFNELFSDFSLENLGQVMYSYMQLIWGSVISLVTALPSMFVNFLLEKASDLFRAMGFGGIADGIDKYREIFNKVLDTIKNLPMRIWEYIKDAWANIAGFFQDPIGKLSNLAGTIGTAFANAIKNIGSSAGDWISNLWPFAKGGIVTGPTPALVGEAGPEAIIPLDKAGGLGATYVININGDVYGVSDLESRIERVIQRTASRSFYR